MQYLGKISKEVGLESWRIILEEEWGIVITESISKYTINNNDTKQFVKAVVSAFTKIKKGNYRDWIGRENELPEDYK
ncbi:hypothetical protein A0257_22295 [Hymenobacter psoromatis]|nr:hypothetical protein A0257_22295 [Hymenobacter psoromatis]